MFNNNSIQRAMCSSRKNPYPPHGRSTEIPRRRGVLKAKILEAKYEANWNFLGGLTLTYLLPIMTVWHVGKLPGGSRDVKQKTFHGGSMDY